MRKLELVLATVLLVGGATVASAQDPQPQGQRAGGGRGMGAMLMQGITLTAEQQAKVDSINSATMRERQDVMRDESMDQEARRAKGRELMTRQTDAIRALLNDEQKKTFDKNLEEMRSRGPQGAGRPPQR